MEHNIIKEKSPNGFYKVTCTEGHYITQWKEGDDILNFLSYKIAYCGDENAEFNCITDEQNTALMEQKMAAIEAMKTDKEKAQEAQINASK